MVANVWVGEWPKRALDLTVALGSTAEAAKVVSQEMGRAVSDNSLKGMLRATFPGWQKKLERAMPDPTAPEAVLRDRVKDLESEVERLQRRVLTDERVKREILGLTSGECRVPDWVLKPRKKPSSPGVPTLFASDWHWGEVVDPNQIGGVNSYDLQIANRRARRLIENTCDLVLRHTVNPDVPGIVFALGGDMLSGDIHEELSITNDSEWGPMLLDLQGALTWCIKTLRDEIGKVFVPCVTGNHSRTSKKPRAKGRNWTNFDWLLYQQLRLHFADDDRVKFLVPDGPNAQYEVAGWRYLLTHGDAAKGGDGIIGNIGPAFRLDVRMRARNAQIGKAYDTALLAHFHEYRSERRRIQNGSLVGYNEFAANVLNCAYEPPQQALFFTHHEYGPTIHMPVFVEPGAKRDTSAKFVQWAA